MTDVYIKKISHPTNKLIMLGLALLATHVYGSDQIIMTADKLTKSAYNSSQVQDILTFFSEHAQSAQTDDTPSIPSVKEIIEKVTHLEHTHIFAQNNVIKQQAIRALQATLHATEKAILLAYMRQQNSDHDNNLLIKIYNNLILLLKHQKLFLEKKIAELLDETSTHSFTLSPTTKYLIGGIALSMALAGFAGAYYLGLFDSNSTKTPAEPIIFSHAFDEKRDALYKKMGAVFHNFIDPAHKQPITTYLDEAKKIAQDLDPATDAPVIEMLNTIAESHKRMETGLFNQDFFENARFWKETYAKKPYYTQILTEVLNHDPIKGQTINPENLDIREILSQKSS